MRSLRRFFQHFGRAVRDHAHKKRVTRLLALALLCLPVAASAVTSGNITITDQTFSLPTGDAPGFTSKWLAPRLYLCP
jgi:hypothetical protein